MLDRRITELLVPLKTRYFLKRVIQIMTFSLMVSGGISASIMIISRFTPITFIWNKVLVILSISLLTGIILSLFRKPSFKETATLVDSYELKERVATSLELRGEDTIVAKIQKEDTIRILERGQLKSKISLRPATKIFVFILVFLIATVSISFIPTKSFVLAKEKETNLQKIEEEKAKIQEVKIAIKKDEGLTLEEKKEVEESLERINKKLKDSKNSKDIQKELIKAKKELNEIKKDMKQRKLEEIGEKLQENAFTKELGQKLLNKSPHDIAKQIEEMSKEIKNLNKEELEKLIKELENLKNIFENNPKLEKAFEEIGDAAKQSIKQGNLDNNMMNQSLQSLNSALNSQLNNPQISSVLNEAIDSIEEINNTLGQMSDDKNNGTNENQSQTRKEGQEDACPTGEHSGEGD